MVSALPNIPKSTFALICAAGYFLYKAPKLNVPVWRGSVTLEHVFWAVCVLAVVRLLQWYLSTLKVDKLDRRTVLITGCDTGFGHGTALALDRLGVRVIAGCLTADGARGLQQKASKRLTTVIMDVTNEASVKSAFQYVQQKNLCPNGLHGLINNAGLLRGSLLDMTDMRDWRLQMEVNVMGMVTTTKQFLDLLVLGRGRIINVASVAGRFATATTSSYNATKFAVEGLSDSWRRELKSLGVGVSIVEPGIMKTPLWNVPTGDAEFERSWNALTREQQKFYGREQVLHLRNKSIRFVNALAGHPKLVIDTLVHAVTARFPCTRYSVGIDANYFFIPLSYLPVCISDPIINVVMSRGTPPGMSALKEKQNKAFHSL